MRKENDHEDGRAIQESFDYLLTFISKFEYLYKTIVKRNEIFTLDGDKIISFTSESIRIYLTIRMHIKGPISS
jgi:hypothetical protein